MKEFTTIQEIAEYACSFDGDLAEIGAGEGNTTLILLNLAERFGKKVLVVDPFEEGWHEMPESYGKGYPKAKFDNSVEGKEAFLNLCKQNSLSAEAEAFLKVPLCFVFVDGLQYKGAVLNDLRNVAHARIIVVDDFNRTGEISQVPLAVGEFMGQTNRKLTIIDRWAVLTE